MNRDDIIFLAIVVFFLWGMIFVPIYLFIWAPETTSYEYDVKAEQMYDTDTATANNTQPLDALPPDEQRVMHEAFKKSDHFMGSSSVTIQFSTQQNVTKGLYPIEENGVVMVVSITETQSDHLDYGPWWMKGLLVWFLGTWIIFVFCMIFIPLP